MHMLTGLDLRHSWTGRLPMTPFSHGGAGLLGSSSVGASPEAGFLQLPGSKQKGQQELDRQRVGGSSERSKASALAAA